MKKINKKINGTFIVGLLFFLISILMLYNSVSYSYLGKLGPGPGFFPVWLSGFLVILTVLYMYHTLKNNDLDTPFPMGEELRNVLYVLACIVIFIILFNLLGFIVSSSLFLFLLLHRGYKWRFSILISIVSSLFLYWLFGMVLGVALPLGFGL